MFKTWLAGLVTACTIALSAVATAENDNFKIDNHKDGSHLRKFTEPERLTAAGKVIQVEAPGYAFPALADMDGDGKKDLLVGQFRDGKIKVYKSLGDGKFADGEWLKSEGGIAEVPGVW